MTTESDRRASVLVIDDERLMAILYERILRPNKVRVVASAKAALDALANEQFDVIFCDLMMPGMTGVELYDHLCSTKPDVAERMVFVTGGVFSEPMCAFVEAHSERCLEKPIKREQIRAIVEDAKAGKQTGGAPP